MGSNGHSPHRSRSVLQRLLGTDRRVAFVFSGGVSLGAIQVGMLKALFEAGIKPDLLVGTSVGAINAAWIAGWPSKEGVAKLEDDDKLTRTDAVMGTAAYMAPEQARSAADAGPLADVYSTSAVLYHMLCGQPPYGNVPAFSRLVVPSLLASCAIPGVFPPVTIGRRDLVDGGVANHTSIDAAVRLGASRIYVLPISYPWLYDEPTNALGMALQALARMVAQRLESEVAAYRDAAEIIVIPPLEPMAVSPADFSHTAELIEHGYGSTRKMLAGRRTTKMRPELRPSTETSAA